jgi:hypothetical protein
MSDRAVSERPDSFNNPGRTHHPVCLVAQRDDDHPDCRQLLENGEPSEAKIACDEDTARHRGMPKHVVIGNTSCDIPLGDQIEPTIAQGATGPGQSSSA